MQIPGWAKAAAIFLLLLLGGTVLWWQLQLADSQLVLSGQRYHTTVMRSDKQLQAGLSGTDSLPSDEAMLFVFPRASNWPIWMKDMSYPIDIVWLDDSQRVVHVVKNAQPASYPTQFVPDSPSRYVVELPSGTATRTNIKKGDQAYLPKGI